MPNNLLPYVAQAAASWLKKLRVRGSDYAVHNGTGVRDYIQMDNLADGHMTALTIWQITKP